MIEQLELSVDGLVDHVELHRLLKQMNRNRFDLSVSFENRVITSVDSVRGLP